MTSWVRRLFAARPRPVRSSGRRFVLDLESLDGRATPALLSGVGNLLGAALPELTTVEQPVSTTPTPTDGGSGTSTSGLSLSVLPGLLGGGGSTSTLSLNVPLVSGLLGSVDAVLGVGPVSVAVSSGTTAPTSGGTGGSSSILEVS